MAATRCNQSDVDIVLCSVANALKSTTDVAENVICEATRTTTRHDLYFLEQCIYKAKHSLEWNTWSVVQYFPDGRHTLVPLFVSSESNRATLALRQHSDWRWWEKSSQLRIPKQGRIRTTPGHATNADYQKILFASAADQYKY